MKKVFDAHIHHLFKMPIEEAIRIFKLEFPVTGTEGGAFLSIPNECDSSGAFTLDKMQNLRILFLKKAFSPAAYAFAGLEHPTDVSELDGEFLAEEYLRQAKEYRKVGFDGMKMLEGYPSVRKAMKRSLCDEVYDKYYSYLEENNIPVTMHVANPEENWDISKASPDAIALGRVYDSSYPTRLELIGEVFGILKKHPKLNLALAHFGFMSYDIGLAERFLEYENTYIDLTPGGEQLINISENWNIWQKFFEKHQDRIIYGSDYYAFPMDESWEVCFTRRPKFIREFFETTELHDYLGTSFRGIGLKEEILDKIYKDNAMRRLGKPRKIDLSYLKRKCSELLSSDYPKDEFAAGDLKYIIQNTDAN